MAIKDLIDKFRGNKEPEEEYEPKPLIDRQLDSLKRERQFQMNQEEKVLLKQQIAEYKKQKLRDGLFGKLEKEKQLLGEIKKKTKVLDNKNNLLKQKSMLKQKSILGGNISLNNKKNEFKKNKQMSFLK